MFLAVVDIVNKSDIYQLSQQTSLTRQNQMKIVAL